MLNPRGLLIDLDNTLYDFDAAHAAALAVLFPELAAAAALPADAVPALYFRAMREINEDLARSGSSHNRMLYLSRFFELAGGNAVMHTLRLHDLYWEALFAAMRCYPGCREVLAAVRGRFATCLVTDMTAHIQYRKLEKLKLLDVFDAVVTSEETGYDKPHPQTFLVALHKLGLRPEEALVIGDCYERDIEGALRVGSRALWFTPHGVPAGTVLPAAVAAVTDWEAVAARLDSW